jgi:hypothetical protein
LPTFPAVDVVAGFFVEVSVCFGVPDVLVVKEGFAVDVVLVVNEGFVPPEVLGAAIVDVLGAELDVIEDAPPLVTLGALPESLIMLLSEERLISLP